MRNLKQVINQILVLKKMHRVIGFNHEASLKSYINMNTELREKTKNDFNKDFFEANEQRSFWKNFGKCEKT